jgi:DNA-binding GntR family transcriptional regulator
LGVRDVVERFEVMATLEGMCGRLAARRITEPERVGLLAVHDACSREAAGGDPDAYYYENERFHHAIYAACHNAFLAEQARQLHKRLKPYRRLQLRVRNHIMGSFREHQAIVDAILAGDGEAAERQLRDHVLIQGERLTDFLATLDSAAVA